MGVVNLAKYDVTYSCGHSAEVQLFGPMKEREAKLMWYRTEAVCPACYRAHKQAEVQQGIEAIRDEYVELRGSERQIAWASEIRMKFIQTLDSLATSAPSDDQAVVRGIFHSIVNNHTDSKWWIDNRNRLRAAIKDEYVEALKEAGLH